MIRPAYNTEWLQNLDVIKTAREWADSNFISEEQLDAISESHPVGFFHPNFFIRILLFVATLVALAGATALLFMMFSSYTAERFSVLAFVLGGAGILLMEMFVKSKNHYKSGVTEAVLYYSEGFLIGGVVAMTEGNEYAITIACIVVFLFAAVRYIDLVSTAAAMFSFAYLIFLTLYDLGGILQNIIPFVMIVLFLPLYFQLRGMRFNDRFELWEQSIILGEALALLAVYAGGNYFVVREMSVSMMYLDIAPGDDIPFAFVFYALTVVIPLACLYYGIRLKDFVLLRVSLALLAFSVFTFKYYYSTGHHEITLTVGGVVLIGAALWLFRFLRTPRKGYTHQQLKVEKWAESNAEAFVISQTMGGNVAPEKGFEGGGGAFGGGGASGTF
jgi:uncharacterized membrane protein YgcG